MITRSSHLLIPLAFSIFFTTSITFAQNSSQTILTAVRCQLILADEVTKAEYFVENFDKTNQAFLSCETADDELEPKVSISGSLPLRKGMGLSLEDFNIWNQNPLLSEIFVNSPLGAHSVRTFNPDAKQIDSQDADKILGLMKSRPVTSQVCEFTLAGGGGHGDEDGLGHEHGDGDNGGCLCPIGQHEVCTMEYGRPKCKCVADEPPACHEETTLVFFRHVPTLVGYVKQKADTFCPTGMVEKRTRLVNGLSINERRCCESKVIDGELLNICNVWQTY